MPRINGPVTSFQHSFIVSEQVAAVICGYDAPGQAEQVIDRVARPSVREQLREACRSLGLSAQPDGTMATQPRAWLSTACWIPPTAGASAKFPDIAYAGEPRTVRVRSVTVSVSCGLRRG